MKKGKSRIVIGCVLLVLQMVSMSSGNAPGIHVGGSTELIAYEIAACLGYYGPGICGLVLLFLGLKAYCSDDKTVVEESVNGIPAPEPEKAPMNIVPEETAPAFVAPPRPEAPLAYGGGVVKHDTHTIALEHIAAPAVTAPKKSKQRFCKYCGGAIDPATKECTRCGKPTYLFKIKKSTVKVIFTVLIVANLIALNVFQYLQNLELSEQAGYYCDVVYALDSDELGISTKSFMASSSYIVVGADEQDRRFTLTAHNLDKDSITVSYSSDAATVSFDKDQWRLKVNVEVIPNHPGVSVVTFEDDKSGKSFDFLIIVTE